MNSQPIDQSPGDQGPEITSVTFRPVGPEDGAFLLELYASTRAEEMAMVPWTDEQREVFVKMQFTAQQDHYREAYPNASREIILSHGRPVGHRYVARLEKEIRIVDITLAPAERNRGIGTFSLGELLNEGKRSGKVVRIYVENYNPSLLLFERLGFRQVEEHGVHLLMEWSVNSS
jgi:ribosomal protein S18 acetylase RimI-like enzyme